MLATAPFDFCKHSRARLLLPCEVRLQVSAADHAAAADRHARQFALLDQALEAGAAEAREGHCVADREGNGLGRFDGHWLVSRDAAAG